MELMALCVNISMHPKIGAHFAQHLRLLLRQSMKNRDSLMLKLVRNILAHDIPEKKIILSSLNEIVSVVKDCPHEEVSVVGLGGEYKLCELVGGLSWGNW